MSETFEENIERKRSITEKYRLAIIDEEDLKEIRSFRVSLLNVYMLVSAILIITGVIIVLLFFFTPIKRLIPGYANVEQNVEFLKLRDRLDEVEKALELQELYNNSLRKMIKGEVSDDIVLTDLGDQLKVNDQLQGVTKAGRISPEEIGDTKSTKLLGSLFFVPPVTGQISSGFLDVEAHYGVDILAPSDSPIKAIMDGVIVFSDWTMEAGNSIAVQHANNIVSLYKHNSVLLKKAGERVEAGEALAIIGNTGTLTDGPHLHFELWYEGFPVDPEKYISFN